MRNHLSARALNWSASRVASAPGVIPDTATRGADATPLAVERRGPGGWEPSFAAVAEAGYVTSVKVRENPRALPFEHYLPSKEMVRNFFKFIQSCQTFLGDAPHLAAHGMSGLAILNQAGVSAAIEQPVKR